MRAAVTLHIDAPPPEVWALVTDITKLGEYSPEVVEAEWLDGATGPAVGARYRGRVRRNENWPVLYWTTCEVTQCVPNQVFEFAVVMRDRPVNTWRYELLATQDGGTDVTESWEEIAQLPIVGRLMMNDKRAQLLTDGCRQTLERIKAVAESPSSGGAD